MSGTEITEVNTAQQLKIMTTALAGVAPWIERQSANQKAAQFDSQSGHTPGLWARSPVGGL